MNLKVIDEAYGQGLRTERFIAAGDIVIELEGKWVDAPSKYTIQLGADRHLKPEDQLWALINHSCDPNLRVNPKRRLMIAARDIHAGESLSFNYLSTEWDMAAPFRCMCESTICFENISGSRYLNAEQRNRQLVWALESDSATEAG